MKALLAAMTATAALGFATAVMAEDMAYVVNEDNWSIDESLTGVAGDPEAGKAAFVGRTAGNCLACHAVEQLADSEQFHGEVGPDLSDIGNVYTEEELRLRVVNIRAINEDAIMPSFLKSDGFFNLNKKFEGKSVLTAQEIEDVVAYLKTLQL